ncbi:MAG TPA: hypothetical protein PLL69_07200 [Gemmatimonadales bacterium]|nr:hypothetical protein [Gemmatimonadales bacterium]
MMRFRGMMAVVACLSQALPAAAQAGREVVLGSPTASHSGEFSLLRLIREQADGSVLIADPIEGALVRLDKSLARATPLGRVGPGPGEYRQPDAVWPLPGDSSLLVDLGNNRLTVLDPAGRFGNTRTLAEPSPDGGLKLLLPGGVDRAGGIYYRGGRPGDDSLPVFRFDRATGQSTEVARYRGPAMRQESSGGENNRRQSVSSIPWAPADGWAVGASGRIFLVRAHDYHVEVINPDGSRTSGVPVRYTPVRIGAAERAEYDASVQRGGSLGIEMRVSNGEPSLSMTRGRGRPGGAATSAANFPATKPPFDPGDIWVDSRERLWVRRHQAAGQPALYDVFDQRGSLVGSVRFGVNRRMAGMGKAAVYVARWDDDDLMYLERYALPL